jgi:hypothetical protein
MNKKQRIYFIVGIVILIVIIGGILLSLRIFNGGEDNWIKNSLGIYIEHGVPDSIPDYVLDQQNGISCALDLYSQAKLNGIVLNSQCLGSCGNYSVDIVNVPRSLEDDKSENQCSDYPKVTPYFIELDKNGSIVRVLDYFS